MPTRSAAASTVSRSADPTPVTLHLIGNSHLDPVWLWDWREGLNEALITCRSILAMMDEDPELTYVRGEAAIYDHIQRHDPRTFDRIRAYAYKGRWDVVGGTWIQPDTNLPGSATFIRHLTRGQEYFRAHFGHAVTTAWAADSFGHAAGLPELWRAGGIDNIAFTRPFPGALPTALPFFWWEGDGGARILCYRPPVGWYGCERGEAHTRLDSLLASATSLGLPHIGAFFGLGNHGGGPTRHHVAEIKAWRAAHPEVRVTFSGLHSLFAAVRLWLAANPELELPVIHGELNYCLRGCYVSMAGFKLPYRRAEASLAAAERTAALVRSGLTASTLTPATGRSDAVVAVTASLDTILADAWDQLLFNSFHDVLPGTSIERAMREQIDQVGAVAHAAQRAELAALNALALQVDTTVTPPPANHPSAVAMLVWNPHPTVYDGPVELETCLDYRPIFAYQGRAADLPVQLLGPDREPLAFQVVETENHFFTAVPWRRRVVTHLTLPPGGWSVLEFGWVESPRLAPPLPVADTATSPAPGVIANNRWRVAAEVGGRGVRVERDGQALLGGDGLGAVVVDDRGGSWGGLSEEADQLHLTTILESWTVTHAVVRESGPLRARLWVRLAGAHSRLDLTLSLSAGRDVLDVHARVLWAERAARLKLRLPGGAAGAVTAATFEVPGGTVRRGLDGEVPGGRWVRTEAGDGADLFGFASDGLYGFDLHDGELRASVVRASRYADDAIMSADAMPWRPATDQGEHQFRFILTGPDADLWRLSRDLEVPPTVLPVAPSPGVRPRTGSLAHVSPASAVPVGWRRSTDGREFWLTFQETAGEDCTVVVKLDGKTITLGMLHADSFGSWRLYHLDNGEWDAVATRL